jgi:hypothetical protein
MGKKNDIRDLFANFKCEDFFDWNKPFKFKCDDEETCKCNSSLEPIWTPAFGDEIDTTVMLIGEAPSTTGGKGTHLGVAYSRQFVS